MTDTIAVVERETVLLEAYEMGHDEFSELDLGTGGNPDVSSFTDSARWANVVMPELRSMAGFADSGHGTFQQNRDIALIPGGNEDDRPAEAIKWRAADFSHKVVDAWMMGAHDGATGTWDPDSALA